MIDFDFISPTKIYFGKNKEFLIGDICLEHNYKKVLIVIGKGSVKRSGLFDKVLDNLNQKQIDYRILEGVRANPTIEKVREGAKLAKEYNPDLILAIGGGSVCDTSKNIAVSYYYDGDPFDFNLGKIIAKKALPIGVILTISASGSELSTSCVIQDDTLGIKNGFNTDLVRPVFAIENPELTYSVNKEQTAYGVVDIMMHTLERYFQKSSDNEPADGFAEALLRSVIKAGKKVMEDPCDYESRAVLMLMSSYSHNGLTNLGKPKGMPVHKLEHALSGVYPSVAHAAGLSVIFPKWARYYVEYDADKFDSLAKNVFNLHNSDKMINALDGIKAIEDLFSSMGMPLSFKDLGLNDVDVDKLVNIATNNGTRVVDHYIKPLDKDGARKIYSMCL